METNSTSANDQFSLSRAALSNRGCAKSKFLSVKRHSCGDPPGPLSVLAVLVVVLLPAFTLAQEFPAFVQTETYSNMGWSIDTTRGWKFTVSAEIQVQKLAFWDSDPDGLDDAHPIGIWRDEDQVLLTSATVPAGTAAPLEGTFRWVPTQPVVLSPGKTYVIGAYWVSGSGDRTLGGGANTVFDARVTVTGGRGNSTTGLNFPWFAVAPQLNANFKAVPAPAPIIITDASLAGTRFTLRFRSAAGLTNWTVMGSSNLQGFTDDRTANSTITEPSPGIYQAVVELGGVGNKYFLRIAR
jgi:hypothetical protein